MIRIVETNKTEDCRFISRDDLLKAIKTMDDIIKNSEYEYDDNYLLSFEDMTTIKESIRKLKEGI